MNSPCPYICNNKTEYGYCKTTGCINPKMKTIEVTFTTSDKEFNAFLKGVEVGRRDVIEKLVRCKDCRWAVCAIGGKLKYCKKHDPMCINKLYYDTDFFCRDAERREDADNRC